MAAAAGSGPGPGPGTGSSAGTGSSNPRKFSEKIALQKQRQAEETAAFEEVMMEICSTRLQAQKLRLAHSRGPFYGGSLPNVNQIGSGVNDFQGSLHSPLDSTRSTRHHGLVERVQRDPRRMVSPLRRYVRQIDSSPYGPTYLSPPPEPGWRRTLPWGNFPMDKGHLFRLPSALNRTNSDSALHTSVMNPAPQDAYLGPAQGAPQPGRRGGFRDGDADSKVFVFQVPPIEESFDDPKHSLKPWDAKKLNSSSARPRSCEVPGIHIFPSPDQPSIPVLPPSLNSGGSLPDLTTLHFPSPLPTPLDPDDGGSFPALGGTGSTGSLASTMTQLGISGAMAVGAAYEGQGLPSALQSSLHHPPLHPPPLQSSLSNPNLQASLRSPPLHSSLSNPSLPSSHSSSSIPSSLSNPSLSNQSFSNQSLSNQSLSNPSLSNQSLSNQSFSNQSLSNQSLSNPSLSNQSFSNQSLSNQSLSNPSLSNQSLSNQSLSNQSLSNQSLSNQSFSNPSLSNPSLSNQSLSNQSLSTPSLPSSLSTPSLPTSPRSHLPNSPPHPSLPSSSSFSSPRRRVPLSPLTLPMGGDARRQHPKQFSPTMSPTLSSIAQGVPLDTSKLPAEQRLPPYPYNQPGLALPAPQHKVPLQPPPLPPGPTARPHGPHGSAPQRNYAPQFQPDAATLQHPHIGQHGADYGIGGLEPFAVGQCPTSGSAAFHEELAALYPPPQSFDPHPAHRQSPPPNCSRHGAVPNIVLTGDSPPGISKEIAAALSAVPGFEVEASLGLEDELRIEPLSLDGLHMLSDPYALLTDPAVEDSFRTDRLQ